MKFLMLALSCLFFVSCVSTEVPETGNFTGPFRGSYLSRISVGMPKAEMIRQIGEPFSVSGNSSGEVFVYRDDQRGWWQYDYYYVRLIDGKVESYGGQPIELPALTNPVK
jgi:hypothetical protein